jgi:hypothetical protein
MTFGGRDLSRVEMYRTKRHRRRMCFGAVLLFAFILTAGILTVDLVTNSLVCGQRRFSIAAFENRGSTLEITFMNRTFCINTEYLNRDLERLRQLF